MPWMQQLELGFLFFNVLFYMKMFGRSCLQLQMQSQGLEGLYTTWKVEVVQVTPKIIFFFFFFTLSEPFFILMDTLRNHSFLLSNNDINFGIFFLSSEEVFFSFFFPFFSKEKSQLLSSNLLAILNNSNLKVKSNLSFFLVLQYIRERNQIISDF